MLLQILNFFPIHYITIFTFLIAAVLGVATAVVHAQYQHIVKTNNTMDKETKRKSRNGLLITFCIFAFISLLSFVFQKRLVKPKISLNKNFVSDEASNVDNNSKHPLMIEHILQSIGMQRNLSGGQYDTKDINILDDEKIVRPVSVFTACCETDNAKQSTSLIYSPPDGYEFIDVTRHQYTDRSPNPKLQPTDRDPNPGLVKIKFDKYGNWTRAIQVTGIDDLGIHLPSLQKEGDPGIPYNYLDIINGRPSGGIPNIRIIKSFK